MEAVTMALFRSSRVDELADAIQMAAIHKDGAQGPWGHLYDPAGASAAAAALAADSTDEERRAACVRLITGDTEAGR